MDIIISISSPAAVNKLAEVLRTASDDGRSVRLAVDDSDFKVAVGGDMWSTGLSGVTVERPGFPPGTLRGTEIH